jgi:hypothetical protein
MIVLTAAKVLWKSRIWSSHPENYEKFYIVERNILQFDKSQAMFQRNM